MYMTMSGVIFVTGGAGFIGSALVRQLASVGEHVVVIDALTYAGNLGSLASVTGSFVFEREDVCDRVHMERLFEEHRPRAIVHLAAETHVDRSIDGPSVFLQTNVLGTFSLLEAAFSYWRRLPTRDRDQFRFHHVSTDEVFGALGNDGHFDENSPYRPNSPYSASKAGSDHLVRAWHQTYGLPVIITNSSNNYGPYQFPDKLVPLSILNAMRGEILPVYGLGHSIRDWLHVDDHAHALRLALSRGQPGRTYLIGGRAERTNIDVVRTICRCVEEAVPDRPVAACETLIRFVPDRPGHDWRYAVDPSLAETELGWKAERSFEAGILQTVAWYAANQAWCATVPNASYRGLRLGLGRVTP